MTPPSRNGLLMQSRLLVTCCLVAISFLHPLRASSQETLPYGARTRPYSGFSTTVHGDIRTVGMAGATVGLADTFMSAIDNPAGLAMTLRVGDINYSGDFFRDGNIQDYTAQLELHSAGAAVTFYPWAISAGYLSHYREEARYLLPSALDNPARLNLATHGLFISGARVFFHNRLSIGATLIVGQAARDIAFDNPKNGDQSFSSYTAGATFGAMVQLPYRLLLGASFSLPMKYPAGPDSIQANTALPGFFQSVDVPWRAGLGLGFIPNRFFRADLTMHLVGTTPDAALVRNEAALTGQHITLQPRIGAAYVFADYKEIRGTLFAGTYLEFTRIEGTASRLHGTGGLEAKIWVFTAGAGFDAAAQYRNYLFSFGVDVFDVLARLGMLPITWSPKHQGLIPHKNFFSDEGLARPLVKNWKQMGPDIDPIKAALGIPAKLGQGLQNASDQLEHIGQSAVETLAPPKAEPAKAAAEKAEKKEAAKAERAEKKEEAKAAAEKKEEAKAAAEKKEPAHDGGVTD